MTENKYKYLNELVVVELKAELEKRGLEKTGVKQILVERLKEVLIEEGFDPETYQFEMKEEETTEEFIEENIDSESTESEKEITKTSILKQLHKSQQEAEKSRVRDRENQSKQMNLMFEMLKNINEQLNKSAAMMDEQFEKMDRNFEKIEVTCEQVRQENKVNLEKLEITKTNKLQQKKDKTEKENVIKDIEKDEKERDYSRTDSLQKNMEIINECKDSKNDVVIRNNENEMLSGEYNIDNMKNEVERKKNEKEKCYSRIDTMQYNMEIRNESKKVKNDVLIRNNEKETLSKEDNIDNMKNKVEGKHEHDKMGNMENNMAIISEVEDRKIEMIMLNEEYNVETMKKEIEEYNGIENIKGDIEGNLIGKIVENKVFNQSDMTVNVNTSAVSRVISSFYNKFQRINKNIMKKKLRLIHVRPFKRKNKKGFKKKKKKKKIYQKLQFNIKGNSNNL